MLNNMIWSIYNKLIVIIMLAQEANDIICFARFYRCIIAAVERKRCLSLFKISICICFDPLNLYEF